MQKLIKGKNYPEFFQEIATCCWQLAICLNSLSPNFIVTLNFIWKPNCQSTATNRMLPVTDCQQPYPQLCTTVPIGSPLSTLIRFPTVSISNTTIGKLFSLHIVVAVRSIIFRPLV